MTKETLKRAKELDGERYCYERMLNTMDREDDHWWALQTPDKAELYMPNRMRGRFKRLVIELMDEVKKEIEEL